MSRLFEILQDKALVDKIREKLPKLFHIAELEMSRGGKVTMEVGNARERILIALLIYKFGEQNVDVDISATEHDIDVKLFGEPISIKTITIKGNQTSGVKVVWTVDWQKVKEFVNNYRPISDLMLARIKWEETGGLYLIPIDVQQQVFRSMGKDIYLKTLRQGTNPRGVEFSSKAMAQLISHDDTKVIPIDWIRPQIRFNLYERWLDYWREN